MKNSIDNIVTITLNSPNRQIIQIIDVSIDRPYKIHTIYNKTNNPVQEEGVFMYNQENILETILEGRKTHVITKEKVQSENLSEIARLEKFNDAFLVLEFYKTNANNEDYIERAKEIYARLTEVLKKVPINVAIAYLENQKDINRIEYNSYITLKATNPEVQIQRMIIKNN